MSRKNVAMPYQCITNGDMSGTVIGEPTTVTYLDNGSYQVVCTGTPEGEFFVDATINDVNWEALDITPRIEAVGAPISFLINLNQLPYNKIRLRYVPTGGTGVLNAWTMTKMIGG